MEVTCVKASARVYDKNCVQLLKKLLSKLQGLCTITLAVNQVYIIIIMVILEIIYQLTVTKDITNR